MDRKKSIQSALERYSTTAASKLKPKRKNKSPEKDVERECMIWMNSLNWSVQIISSKAQYNPKAQRWISQAAAAGTCDCIGTMPDGTFVAVEFKSKGQIYSFNRPSNARQREYIRNKISSNAFACVVDSAKLLQSIYEAWISIEDVDQKKAFLFAKLP